MYFEYALNEGVKKIAILVFYTLITYLIKCINLKRNITAYIIHKN